MADIQRFKNLDEAEATGRGLTLYGGLMLPENFGQVVEFSRFMSEGGLAVPAHLRGKPGTCMAVIQRSLAWQMDPWAVATKTYAVNDVLAYEAQLIAAVVKKWAPVKEKVIAPTYTGDGQALQCSFTLHHKETNEVIEYQSPKIGEIKPQNSPLWKTDPQQQLYYYSVRALARRHFPDILLGVYDREEALAMRDITPTDNALVEDQDAPEPVSGEVMEPDKRPPVPADFEIDRGIEPQVPLDDDAQMEAEDADIRHEGIDPETGEMEGITGADNGLDQSRDAEPKTFEETMLAAIADCGTIAALEAWKKRNLKHYNENKTLRVAWSERAFEIEDKDGVGKL